MTTKSEVGSPAPAVQSTGKGTAVESVLSTGHKDICPQGISLVDDQLSETARAIHERAQALDKTIFADTEPFDPAKFVADIIDGDEYLRAMRDLTAEDGL